jgi:hypothetical protein
LQRGIERGEPILRSFTEYPFDEVSGLSELLKGSFSLFYKASPRHCEKRSDEAIHRAAKQGWIASLQELLAMTSRDPPKAAAQFYRLFSYCP